jgi:ATP-dependent Clp protease ATP-binding subunit ClpA
MGPADVLPDPPIVNFTKRAMSVLRSAQASAADEGMADIDTGHVLRALLTHGRIAMEILRALDITAQQVRVDLDKRVTLAPASRRGATTEPAVSRQVALAIELAANESSGLGNGYVGSEHLLLGLIGEPDGAAGKVLRALGAELRVTRRAVAAALAGWKAGFSAHQERSAEESPSPAAAGQLSAAIKAELEPVLARLERLERRTAG